MKMTAVVSQILVRLYRNATYILSATAKSLGYDPSELTLNKESIRQARRRHRENIAAEVRNSFSPGVPLIVQ